MTYIFIFIFIFIFICIFCITDFMKKSQYILFNRFLIILLFTFFCGLRGTNVSSDYINYIEIFEQVPTLDNLFQGYEGIHGELLYLFINSFIKMFTTDSIFVFLCIAFLTAFINIYYFNKYSPFFILLSQIRSNHLLTCRLLCYFRFAALLTLLCLNLSNCIC